MGGFCGVVSKEDCVSDLFFGTDYHSHLGTHRGGMAVLKSNGTFHRSIHNIQNTPFRSKLTCFLLPETWALASFRILTRSRWS